MSYRRNANIGHKHVAADITDLDLSVYLRNDADGTLTGKLTINYDGEGLLLKDTDATGASAQVNIGFDDSAGTRQGYVGFGSSANQDLYVYADSGDIRLRPVSGHVRMDNASILKMDNLAGTAQEVLQMLASDVLQVGDTPNDTNIQGDRISLTTGATGWAQINSGRPFRFYDSTGSDYAQWGHNGTDFQLTALNTTALELTDISALRMRDGGSLVMYESSATVRNSQLKTFATTGDPLNKTALYTSEGGALTIQSVNIADDATAVFNVDSYGIHWLINTFNSTAFANFGKTSTQAPVDYGSGSNVQFGTTNPDIDGDVNIWPSASTEISVKNRLGSSRRFYLLSFTRDEET